MKKITLFIMVCVTTAACHKELSPQQKFSAFLNTIPDLKFPFQTSSGEDLHAAFYPDTIYKDFIDDGSNGVYAKIKVSDSIHGIIFLMPGDILFPLLVTYNSAGKKLNELALVNLSGDGYNANGTSCVVMNKNLEIHMTDTVNSFERDSLTEEIIEASRKTEVFIENFKVGADGKIIKTELSYENKH